MSDCQHVLRGCIAILEQMEVEERQRYLSWMSSTNQLFVGCGLRADVLAQASQRIIDTYAAVLEPQKRKGTGL